MIIIQQYCELTKGIRIPNGRLQTAHTMTTYSVVYVQWWTHKIVDDAHHHNL
jgi:hypothetical protein